MGLLPTPIALTLLAIIAIAVAKVRIHASLLIAALAIGGAAVEVREFLNSHSQIARAAENFESVRFSARVGSDPTWVQSKVVGQMRRKPAMSFRATTVRVSLSSGVIESQLPIRIFTAGATSLYPGEIVEGEARLRPTHERRVAALFLAEGRVRVAREAGLFWRIAERIRIAFTSEIKKFAGSSSALIPGMVLGDTSLESNQLITQMRRAGLTHLTAVSGENFAIISAFLLSLLSWLFRNLKIRLLITASLLLFFIILVRPSPSVLRAAVMSGVLLISQWRGGRAAALPSLGLAISLLILTNPFLALDPGFALSVAATAGILLMKERVREVFAERLSSQKFLELLLIPISASIFTLPIIVAISGELSLVAIPANIAASIAVAPLTIFGFIAALLAPVLPFVAHLSLLLTLPSAWWIEHVAQYASAAPVLLLPKSYLGAGIAILTLIFFTIMRRRRRWALLLLITSALAIELLSGIWPGNSWLLAFCDVGQGDGYAIHLQDDQALVIDSGPDPVLMNRCLAKLGVKEIPLMILTHFHADHVGGLVGAVKNRSLGEVWISSDHHPGSEYRSTLQTLGAVKIREVARGASFRIPTRGGFAEIQILSPDATQPNSAAYETGSEINNSSIAALISIHGVRIFAAGDIEPERASQIMATSMIAPVDILKVAHHGSSHQDFDLLRALHPKVAVISVGAGNPYGHPARSTINELRLLGAQVYRSDLDGAISVDTSLKIRTLKRDWWKVSWG